MRSTGRCMTCKYPVRIATTDGSNRVILDVNATPKGNVWIRAWGAGDVPVVIIEASATLVPKSEAFKYEVHKCRKRAKE